MCRPWFTTHDQKTLFLLFRLRIAKKRGKWLVKRLCANYWKEVSFRRVGIKPWAENKKIRRRGVGYVWVGQVVTLRQSYFGDKHRYVTFASQATLQNSPPIHPTSHPSPSYPILKINQVTFKCLQRTPTFQINNILPIIMLLDLNILLHTHRILLYKIFDMKNLYTKFLGIMCLSYHFQSFHIKCLRTKGFLRHYQPPAYPAHDIKVITRPHIRKNLFKAEKKSNKIYTPPTEPIGQLYE